MTHNIYTYDEIRNLLEDIREKVSLLREKLDNPVLEPFVKHFPIPSSAAILGGQIIPLERSTEEIHDYREENLDLFIDFYERFCKRMEKMLRDNPQYNHISVKGP